MDAEIKCSQKDTKKMIEAVSNMDDILFIYEPEYYKELYWRDIDMIYPDDQQIVLACGKLGAMRVVKAYIRTAKKRTFRRTFILRPDHRMNWKTF